MKLITLLIFILPFVASGQDHYSAKVSTGSNSGWIKIASFSTTPSGCCTSVGIEAKIHYVNNMEFYNALIQIRFRARSDNSLDQAEWFYSLAGKTDNLVKLKKISHQNYELWASTIGQHSHFFTELTVVKESEIGIILFDTYIEAIDSGEVDVPMTGNYTFQNAGSIGIGLGLASNPNNYKLAVNGTIGAKEVVVETSSTTWWPDYVFHDDYSLMPLPELEAYLKKNKHLPEIPTATEIGEKGQSLGEMNVLLLKKVEELTLYLIHLEKKNQLLEEKMEKIINSMDNQK